MRQLRILAGIPNPEDGTSFYRAMGPLADLVDRYPVNVDFMNGVPSENTIKMYDVIFLQRPATAEQVMIANRAKMLNRIVWVDWDDNMFEIPTDNSSHIYYSQPAVKMAVEQIIKLADFVTVSTGPLKERLSYLNSNIFVVPNALPPEVTNHYKPDSEREKTVLWRGTATHERDLHHFKEEIIALGKEFKDWNFTFIGYWPWFIGEEIKDNFTVKLVPNTWQYLPILNQQRASIGVVPLFDSPFNRCKSNIAALEMGLTGAACVVPNWKEWKLPGVSAYNDKTGFYGSVKWLIEKEEQRRRDGKMLHDTVMNLFTLKRMNEKRWSLLRQSAFIVRPHLSALNPLLAPDPGELPRSPSEIVSELSKGQSPSSD